MGRASPSWQCGLWHSASPRLQINVERTANSDCAIEDRSEVLRSGIPLPAIHEPEEA